MQAGGWKMGYAESVAHALILSDQVGFGVGLVSIETPYDLVYLDKFKKVLGYRTTIHWFVIIPPCLRLGSCLWIERGKQSGHSRYSGKCSAWGGSS